MKGETYKSPPIWMMRQAGRYLPEYRNIRKQAGSFLDLCYNPELAAEVTLQPIRRFSFDAAILFADILLIPDALGQEVSFHEGEGPRLDPLNVGDDFSDFRKADYLSHLSPIFETVKKVSQKLPDETALIGFCGAPWTVATYMIAGRGTPDQKPARIAAYQDPIWFQELIDLLVMCSIDYLKSQIEAGCEIVQIFDSWAGVLPELEFKRWSIEPTQKIVKAIKQEYPHVPIIGFPRGCGGLYKSFVQQTKVDAVSIDTNISPEWARQNLSSEVIVQGNLDPLVVVAGGSALDNAVGHIITEFTDIPFIFNLGHGFVPETPIEHVERVIELIRSAD